MRPLATGIVAFFTFLLNYMFLVTCGRLNGRLSWHLPAFERTLNYIVASRIVSYCSVIIFAALSTKDSRFF